MKRSLRNWLASLIVLAAPSATYAQNFIGDSHLAPVALEARCRVADGMLDSWSRYRNFGSDPLHVAMSSPKKLEVTPVLNGKIPFQASPAFCPIALEFDSDLCEPEQQQAEQVALTALASIAADEPIDVDRHEPAVSLSKDVDGRPVAKAANPLVGSSPMIVVLEEVAIEEVAIEEVAIEEVAVEEVAIEEVAIEEVAIEEVAIEEVAVEEVAIEEVAVEEVAVDEVAVDEVAVVEVAVDEVAVDEVAVVEVAVDEVAVDEVAVEEVAVEEVAVEEVAVEEVAVEEVAVDEVAVDEVAVDEVAVEDVAVEDVAIEEVAVEEVAIEEVAVEEVAIEEVAVEEVAVEEVAVEEVAVEEVAFEEVAVEDVAVEDVAVEDVAVEEVAVEDVAVEEVAVEEVAIEDVAVEEVAIEEVAVDACMACYPWPNLDSALDEEYLPYDLPVAKREAVDEVTSQAVVARISPIDESLRHPIKVDLVNLGGAEENISESMGLSYCVPVAESVEGIDLLAIDSTPLVKAQHVPQLMVGDYYPDDQQLRELDRMARAMQYSVPIDCLVHDWIWRGGEMMASDGPIVAWMNGDRIGQEIGTLASEAFEAIVENSLPVLPILARPIEVNVPAPQQIAAPHGRADELAIAGSVLISIADELDAFASSIRSLGSSIHQAAAQNRAILR